MLVRKCNVCGKIYDDPWKDPSRLAVGELTIVQGNSESGHYMSTDRTDMDLCPECLKRVLEFVDVLKEIHETGGTYGIHIYPKEEETK